MDFNYFPAHARGLFPRLVIGHLDLGEDEIKNVNVEFPQFVADKKAYGGPFGQVPAIKLNDGEIRNQTGAIVRFLAKSYKAKDGTSFYPGPSDPMKSYEIDLFIDTQDAWFVETAKFQVPILDAYKKKDEHFVAYITALLPPRLKKIEETLEKNKTKFLCGDHVTLADFAYGCHILKHVYNHKFEHEHIVKAVLSNYPRAQTWAENFKDYVWEFWSKEGNNYPVAF